MRRSLYPKWVANGRMTQQEADDRIAVMEAIAKDYGGHGGAGLLGGAGMSQP